MTLFEQYDLGACLRDLPMQAKAAIDEIPVTQFNGSSDEQLLAHVLEKLKVEPLVLFIDQARQETHEVKLDWTARTRREWGGHFSEGTITVDGIRFVIEIPFSGEPSLWHNRPNLYCSGGVSANADIRNGLLILIFEYRADSTPRVKEDFDSVIQRISEYIVTQTQQISDAMARLPAAIQQAITQRKAVLAKKDQHANILGIPMKTRAGVPQPVPMKRKLPLPLASAKPGEERFDIGEENYQHILGVIRHEGASFERAPSTFSIHGEESLRDIILAHLNGHYQGEATAEAFRKKGKTDICIEFKNRAAFVGECKNWGGEKVALDALTQLLSYTTWRDVKTSLILFNKAAQGFQAIQAKMPEILQKHPLFSAPLKCEHPGEWRIQCKHPEDATRQMVVHVFLFDLCVGGKA